MSRLEALKALAAKVEAGEWQPQKGKSEAWVFPRDFPVDWYDLMESKNMAMAYEGCLDAAKALHEAVLPGWDWVCRNEGESGFANVMTKDFDAYSDAFDQDGNKICKGRIVSGAAFPTHSINPARAWLIAILKALIAQEEAKEARG